MSLREPRVHDHRERRVRIFSSLFGHLVNYWNRNCLQVVSSRGFLHISVQEEQPFSSFVGWSRGGNAQTSTNSRSRASLLFHYFPQVPNIYRTIWQSGDAIFLCLPSICGFVTNTAEQIPPHLSSYFLFENSSAVFRNVYSKIYGTARL